MRPNVCGHMRALRLSFLAPTTRRYRERLHFGRSPESQADLRFVILGIEVRHPVESCFS